jgi:hypothetical protein
MAARVPCATPPPPSLPHKPQSLATQLDGPRACRAPTLQRGALGLGPRARAWRVARAALRCEALAGACFQGQPLIGPAGPPGRAQLRPHWQTNSSAHRAAKKSCPAAGHRRRSCAGPRPGPQCAGRPRCLGRPPPRSATLHAPASSAWDDPSCAVILQCYALLLLAAGAASSDCVPPPLPAAGDPPRARPGAAMQADPARQRRLHPAAGGANGPLLQPFNPARAPGPVPTAAWAQLLAGARAQPWRQWAATCRPQATPTSRRHAALTRQYPRLNTAGPGAAAGLPCRPNTGWAAHCCCRRRRAYGLDSSCSIAERSP